MRPRGTGETLSAKPTAHFFVAGIAISGLALVVVNPILPVAYLLVTLNKIYFGHYFGHAFRALWTKAHGGMPRSGR